MQLLNAEGASSLGVGKPTTFVVIATMLEPQGLPHGRQRNLRTASAPATVRKRFL